MELSLTRNERQKGREWRESCSHGATDPPGKLTKIQAYRMAKEMEGDTGAGISSSDITLEVATPSGVQSVLIS